jgi:LysR family hydrogen peroxide-inducible transcriptional activator
MHLTLTQLEYIVALDTYGSFLSASEKIFVTQPTLSMQIKKLEDQLGLILFDRSKQPVVATEAGKLIVEQAKKVLLEASRIKEIAEEQDNRIRGKVRVGIIPTIAPYILPVFLSKFLKKHKEAGISVEEMITERIIEKIQNYELDCGILATPLPVSGINVYPLLYEPFVAYADKSSSISKKKIINLNDVDLNEMWILNEGHCMRNQVENMCLGSIPGRKKNNFEYQSGSIETLIRLVDNNGGFTILPELSIKNFSASQMNKVRYFREPEPSREISLATPKNVIRKKIIDALKTEIINSVPDKMKNKNRKAVVKIS